MLIKTDKTVALPQNLAAPNHPIADLRNGVGLFGRIKLGLFVENGG
jgi:hypothetical protein